MRASLCQYLGKSLPGGSTDLESLSELRFYVGVGFGQVVALVRVLHDVEQAAVLGTRRWRLEHSEKGVR